jgi:hypothetical protein
MRRLTLLLLVLVLGTGCTQRDWQDEFAKLKPRPKPRVPPKKRFRAAMEFRTKEGDEVRIQVRRSSDTSFWVNTRARRAGRDHPLVSRATYEMGDPMRPVAALALHTSIERTRQKGCEDKPVALVEVGTKRRADRKQDICYLGADEELGMIFMELLPRDHFADVFTD